MEPLYSCPEKGNWVVWEPASPLQSGLGDVTCYEGLQGWQALLELRFRAPLSTRQHRPLCVQLNRQRPPHLVPFSVQSLCFALEN